MYGEEIARVAHIESPPALTVRFLQRGLFAVTRLASPDREDGLTEAVPRADAFALGLQLRDTKPFELWLEGRAMRVQQPRRGTISIIDYNLDPRANLRHAFDILNFYIPRSALEAVTEEQGERPIEGLRIPPGHHLDDPTVHHLGEALLPALAAPEQANQLFVDHVSLALMSHLVHTYGGVRLRPRRDVGGLSRVQERRAMELLLARIDGEISLDELARECGLSRSHFARAFKRTTGESAHRWLLARRLERARDLLLRPAWTIGEISQALGFADQSHFTRVFHGRMGLTPAAWRRLHQK